MMKNFIVSHSRICVCFVLVLIVMIFLFIRNLTPPMKNFGVFHFSKFSPFQKNIHFVNFAFRVEYKF